MILLPRWTGIIGIEAEDTAVTRLWVQGRSTPGAVIDDDSRIGWYGRCVCLVTVWALDDSDMFHDDFSWSVFFQRAENIPRQRSRRAEFARIPSREAIALPQPELVVECRRLLA